MTYFWPVAFFLLRFFLLYAFLVLIYTQVYLAPYVRLNELDGLSKIISIALVYLFGMFNYEFVWHLVDGVPMARFFLEKKYVASMIEGCNALSISIIFVCFVFSFYYGFKRTLLFSIFGLIVIQLMNLLRLSIIIYIGRYYRVYFKAFHDYVFPLMIYGSVFLLWILWLFIFLNKKDHLKLKRT